MSFYKLDPEVAGGWGANTEFVRIPGKPVVVQKLHYQFDGWLGDDLLESSLCFIVTQKLGIDLRAAELSGFELKEVEISMSDEFRELYPNRNLPGFAWLSVSGKVGVDDFGMDKDGRLVVSAEALDVLRLSQIDNCQVFPFLS